MILILNFYITLLDSFCSLVLGYNWLIWHSPLINWVNRLINFHPSLQENLALSCIVANTPLISLLSLNIFLQSLESAVFISASETSMFISKQPYITIISVVAFLWSSKFLGFSNFELYPCSSNIQANSAKIAEATDLSNVSSKNQSWSSCSLLSL